MLIKFLGKLLRHRHFWREVGYDELSEIYITSMFRSIAVGMTGIFVPLYLLKNGYPLTDILLVEMSFYVARALVFDVGASFSVSRFGAKHTLFAGYFLLILSTALFLTLPDHHWPLWLVGGIWGGSNSWFFIPFHVDFSKVKHKEHGGKELGYLSIINRVGGIAGPIAGGVAATLFGGQYIFLVATVLLIVGAIPLLRTREPIPPRTRLDPFSLRWPSIKRDVYANLAYNVENVLSSFLWPLYLSLFVLGTSAAYAKLGGLATVSVVASMLAAYGIGQLVDNRRGRRLLRFGTTTNAALHLLRPFIKTYTSAIALSVADDAATISYQLPFIKGFYDACDEHGNNRNAYVLAMELSASCAKALAYFLLVLASFLYSPHTVTTLGFTIAAIASLLIMTEKFRALNK